MIKTHRGFLSFRPSIGPEWRRTRSIPIAPLPEDNFEELRERLRSNDVELTKVELTGVLEEDAMRVADALVGNTSVKELKVQPACNCDWHGRCVDTVL